MPSDKNGIKLPLKDLKVSDTLVIYINSQQVKNGAFTSLTVKDTNAKWFNQAIDQALGLATPVPNFIPGARIGDPIFLSNGVAGQKTLAQEPRFSNLKGKNLALPVIEGTPSYTKSHPLIGWVVLRITNVVINQRGGEVEAIEGTIVKVPIRGSSGTIVNPGVSGPTLQSISPSSVRLISHPYAG